MEQMARRRNSDSTRSPRVVWLIQLRWVAIAGVVLALGLSTLFGWLASGVPILGVVAFMATYNVVFWHVGRRPSTDAGDVGDQRHIFLQILCDLGALTMLLHWSGGVSNPFVLFYAFHMALAAMLLSRRAVVVLGATAFLLYGGVSVAEHTSLLPAHPLVLTAGAEQGTLTGTPPSEPAALLVGRLLALVMMLAGVGYFVQAVEQQRRRTKALVLQRERLAMSRERMARIGEISAGVAHTVRNPLHGVQSCIDLLNTRAVALDGSDRELLELASEGVVRIEQVTRRLLRLARDRPPQKVRMDVVELIEDALKFVTLRRAEEDIELETQLEHVVADLDPDKMSEALISLLDNATLACKEGGSIFVDSYQTPDREGVCIAVRDTGAGIAPDDLQKVFDPFFTTKTVGEGSGLGLAVARQTVEDHGGEILVESTPGHGTSFLVRLPIEESAAPGDEQR